MKLPSVSLASVAFLWVFDRAQTISHSGLRTLGYRPLRPWFFFSALLLAMGLGALHALEPGHRTALAARPRETARRTAWLALIVTFSHTAGVFALGVLALYASRVLVPMQFYPWLGILSGLMLVALGIYMVLQRATGTAVGHSHLHGNTHGLWPSLKTGALPSPGALIVLLSAFALHRIAFGLLLMAAFSLGLAGVLILSGVARVDPRRFITYPQMDGSRPIAAALVAMLLGAAIVVQALTTLHLHLPHLTRETLGPVLFVIGLGLILGMRHSTDADHIVALSTILSKQRSIKSAALIGSLWGVGHTMTIFAVGSLIILFGIQIPPRLGLSMEFSVAIMLIVLGLLNLTGLLQRISTRFGAYRLRNPLATAAAPRIDAGLFRNSVETFGLYQCVRPLVIGLIHGLAGSAAVALLVLTTIHNPLWATVYLLIFGLGTIIGMMLMTTAIAVPLTYSGKRFARLSGYLATTSGVVSVCFGSFLVYQLGFLGGLFTRHPHWTPQ